MTRYWMTTDNGICIREWTQEEYDNTDPSSHIYEDVLWNVCMNCGYPFSPATHIVKDMNGDNPHKHLCQKCKIKKDYFLLGPFAPKNRNGGYAYLNTELKCFECGEKEIEGKSVFYQRTY